MQDVATVFIPRLELTVTLASVQQAINQSVKELGYDQPTDDQAEALQKFVSGCDVFVSLPTGSGKSLCFACVSLVFDKLKQESNSITVVLSPLNALMRDQTEKFTSRGMKAAFVSSEQEDQGVYDRILHGEVQLVYFSPETPLSIPHWREMFNTPCYQRSLVCLAVNEAHLVEKW